MFQPFLHQTVGSTGCVSPYVAGWSAVIGESLWSKHRNPLSAPESRDKRLAHVIHQLSYIQSL